MKRLASKRYPDEDWAPKLYEADGAIQTELIQEAYKHISYDVSINIWDSINDQLTQMSYSSKVSSKVTFTRLDTTST